MNLYTKIRSLLMITVIFCICACSNQSQKENKEVNKKAVSVTKSTDDKPKNIYNFPDNLSKDEFPQWMKEFRKTRKWSKRNSKKLLNANILETSLQLGKQYLVNNQTPEGNFVYLNYYMVNQPEEMDEADENEVRQAGALWGITTIYQYEQTPEVKTAIDRGLKFFFKHTSKGPVEGSYIIDYPGMRYVKTGTVALVSLSIIDYLRTIKNEEITISQQYQNELTDKLNGYLEFLNFMYLKDTKHFSQRYDPVKNEKWDNSSPYFDGETILCLIKAAKYLGYTQYKPLIKESVLAMAKTYTTDQWHIDPQSRLTKGFFQWSLMAYWEYQDAGWENSDLFRDYILSLSWWSIHINKIDEKKRNTSYAFEGLIFGYLVAKNNGNNAAASEILYIIDKVLYKLTTWQVGGPLEHENKFLIRTKPHKKSGIGGILNAKDFDNVRIDVVQHQMHAVLLALRYIYN